ncbi:MAG: type VI secretion system ATPase TssH [Myxococcota bacterium]
MRTDPARLVQILTPTAQRHLNGAVGRAASSQHAEATVEHMLEQMVSDPEGEASGILHQYAQNRESLLQRLVDALGRAPTGSTARPVFSPNLFRWIEDTWVTASVEHGETSIRTGMLLYQLIREPDRYLAVKLPELRAISAEALGKEILELLSLSKEAPEAEPITQSKPGAAARPGPAGGGAIERFCENFTEKARAGKIDPIFGRHREIRQTIDILCRRRKNNPIIVGEPGVGKTALVEGLALQIVGGGVPESLKNTEIYGLDLGLLQAGASVRGEFENRLKGVLEEIKGSEKPTILFIDEAHTLIGAGGQAGGSDAANLLKPALARGELRTVAATTWSEYKQYFEKDAALERRFQPVKVDEPSNEDTTVMLRGLKGIYEKAHGVRILDEAVVAAAELSDRYISGRQLPDKAVDLLDTTSARVRVEYEARPEELVELDEEAAALERELAAVNRDQSHGYSDLESRVTGIEEKLAEVREKRDALAERWTEEREKVSALLQARKDAEDGKDQSAQPPTHDPGEDALISVDVTADAVARTVSSWTGVPLGKMQKSNLPIVVELEERLRGRVKGQDHALSAVAEAVRASYAGIRDPDSPIGVMLFVGPSGVGKTETALALTDFLYGHERFITTINMTEFTEKHTVSRLIGSPPGYVGYGEGGLLTEAVRQRPYSVVLLDECEKADPQVMNLFYQIFDKGFCNDGEGRQINFRNTLIIMTSNLATDTIMEAFDSEQDVDPADVVTTIRPELNHHFKPALVGRMTVVPYRPLDPTTLRAITTLKLNKLGKRIEESHGVKPVVADTVIDEIAKRCTEVETGARNVDHIMRSSLTPLVAKELLSVMSTGAKIGEVKLDLADDGSFRVDVVSV